MPTAAPPPPPAPSAPVSPGLPRPPRPDRRLVRLPGDGRVAGVCAGIAAYLGVDPTLVRIAFVVLTIATGAGVPAYVVAWLLMPVDEGDQRRRGAGGPGTVVIVVAAVILLTQVDQFSGSAVLAALLIGAGVLLFTDRDGPGPGRPRSGVGSPTAWRAGGPWGRGCAPRAQAPGAGQESPRPPMAGNPPSPMPGPPRPPMPGPPRPPMPGPPRPPTSTSAYHPYAGAWDPREGQDDGRPGPPPGQGRDRGARSVLGRLGLGLLLLTGGVAALLDRLGVVHMTTTRSLGLIITVAGLTLLVGTVLGRTRLWVAIGLLATLGLMATAIPLDGRLDGISLAGGVGERSATPASVADVEPVYELFMGQQVLDLSAIGPLESDVSTAVRMTAGQMTVVVPADVPVVVTGRIRAGDHDILGTTDSGTDLRIDVTDEAVRQDGSGPGTLLLDLDLAVGEIIVTRAERR